MTSCSAHHDQKAATSAWDVAAVPGDRWPRRRAYAVTAFASLVLWGGIFWAVL